MLQHPNEDDLLDSVAEIYDRSDVKSFLAWVEVLSRNEVVTKKLTMMPYLTQALARPTEFLRLLGPTGEDEIFRSWWIWCKLLADTICGNKQASIDRAVLKISLLAHVVISNNQAQSLHVVDRLYALRLVSRPGLVVRLTDHLYFQQQHRGLSIAPSDAWRDQSSKPFQIFTVAQNISNDELYNTIARLRKVEARKICLWMIRFKVNSTGAKIVAKPMLARVESKRL